MGIPIPDSGAVTEDTGVVGGNLIATGDIDYLFGSDAGEWTAETITGAYGSQLVIDQDGVWTYTADNSNATIQALNTGDTLTEVFSVTSNNGTSTVTITINGVDEPPCFTPGTLIETPQGPRPVETLSEGDLVLTQDDGPQPLRWTGARHVAQADLLAEPGLRPVRIPAHHFGPGLPDRPLIVSRMHNILLTGPGVALNFMADEVFCAAGHLGLGDRPTTGHVIYHHLVFDRHQIVWANGLPSESFLPGPIGIAGFDRRERARFWRRFPHLRADPTRYGPAARQVLRRFEAQALDLPPAPPLEIRGGLTHKAA